MKVKSCETCLNSYYKEKCNRKCVDYDLYVPVVDIKPKHTENKLEKVVEPNKKVKKYKKHRLKNMILHLDRCIDKNSELDFVRGQREIVEYKLIEFGKINGLIAITPCPYIKNEFLKSNTCEACTNYKGSTNKHVKCSFEYDAQKKQETIHEEPIIHTKEAKPIHEEVEKVCDTCEHEAKQHNEIPCSSCSAIHTVLHWKPKVADEKSIEDKVREQLERNIVASEPKVEKVKKYKLKLKADRKAWI